MPSSDPFDLQVVVAKPAPGAAPGDGTDTWTITRRLVTKVTCNSCTCRSCITQCPLGCW